MLDVHIILCYSLCERRSGHMATNLALDDDLIIEAQKVGQHKTKKEAVTSALKEYIKLRKKKEIIDVFGTIDFDENYDYKKARQK